MNVVLANARVVHRGEASQTGLAFSNGYVSDATADALHIELAGHVVLPALINAHDHLQLNNIPRLQHPTPFRNSYEWIDAMPHHRERKDVMAAVDVPTEDRYWHGALKNLIAGATSVFHHDPRHCIVDEDDFPVSVLRGEWAHSLGLGSVGHSNVPRYGPDVRASHDACPADVVWMIHLAEGIDAEAAGELARLDAIECLTSNTVLVHGVALQPPDLARIIAVGAAVVWCPASNLELFEQTLAPRMLLEAGHLTLGTDSRLTGSRDLLEELRVAKGCSDLSSHELLDLVTASAARVLRAHDRGDLEKGKRADCVIIRDGGDPASDLLASSRADLRVVVRNGTPAIADIDFAPWFDACGIETVRVLLDGAPKLLAKRYARAGALALEPDLHVGAQVGSEGESFVAAWHSE